MAIDNVDVHSVILTKLVSSTEAESQGTVPAIKRRATHSTDAN